MKVTDYFPDYVEVGYAKKSYGVKGDLRVFIEDGFKESLESARHCFFLLKGCMVPYFIKEASEGLVKFESCNNPEDTKAIVSRAIYLKKDQILTQDKEERPVDSFDFLTGYAVVEDSSENIIGDISEVVQYPQQEIATVTNGEHTFLIPVNEFNIKAINQEEKLVFMEIPEGLLDL